MIENIGDLKRSYNNLIKDIDFDRLELGLQQPNIFEILQISNLEIRHSNFLAWLLNPDGSHGIGDIFLKRFLREIFSDEKVIGIDQFEIENLDYSNIEVRREWRNIDLLILFNDIVICIENKLYSKEGKDQLTRYKNIVDSEFPEHRKAFVYLTPFGIQSISESQHYSFISYESIIDILRRILEVHEETINNIVFAYINDYLEILKRNFMSNDIITELAQRIYRNHKDLFDFIIQTKPDIAEDFKKYFVQRITDSGWMLGSENKGFVRFLTPEIRDLVPCYQKANGYPKKEGFLFEIDFFWYNQQKMVFKTLITEGNQSYREALSQIFQNVEGSGKPAGQKVLVHFIHSENFKLEGLAGKPDEEIREVIDKFWPKIEAIVSKVEEAMVANKDLLIKAMQPNE